MEMKKKNNVSTLFYVLLLIAPFLLSLLVYNKLPEQMVTHWDINNVPNGYSSKAFGAFALPSILLLTNLLVIAAFKFDPKGGNIGTRFKSVFRWIYAFFTLAIHGLIITYALGFKNFSITALIMFVLGIFFSVLGNYFPKCKQNYTAGIRLPWTLANENNWNKTHRFAGYVWVIGGIALALTSFLSSMWIFLTITIVLIIIPVGYSFILYITKADSK